MADPRTEAWLTRQGIAFELRAAVPIEKFDKQASLHNQARLTDVLDTNRVIQYGLAMEAGDQFPPLVAYDAGGRLVLLDGNNRLEGAYLAHVKTFDSYVVKTDDAYVIDWVTRAINTAIGSLGVTHDEAIQQAVYLATHYAKSAAEVAVHFNLKRTQVENAIRRTRILNKINDDPEITVAAKRNLPGPITDEAGKIALARPRAAALNLRAEKHMANDLFKEMVKNIIRLDSEDAMLRVVTKFSTDGRVARHVIETAGGTVRPGTVIRLRLTTLITHLMQHVAEHPTPEALQLTSQAYLTETMSSWRSLNTSMEGVFKNARKSLNGSAAVRQAGAKR